MRQQACIGWLVLALNLYLGACSRAAEGQRRPPETPTPERSESDREDGDQPQAADDESERIHKSSRQWRRILSSRQYRVTRLKETEEPGTGRYAHSKLPGTYHCVCCGAALFDSKSKFESGTGWPSFWKPADEKHVNTALDTSAPELRMEVTCARCDAHLGHVFDDGPPPTGLRFCINSAALDLVGKGEKPRIGREAETPRSKVKKVRRKKPSPKSADDSPPESPPTD